MAPLIRVVPVPATVSVPELRCSTVLERVSPVASDELLVIVVLSL